MLEYRKEQNRAFEKKADDVIRLLPSCMQEYLNMRSGSIKARSMYGYALDLKDYTLYLTGENGPFSGKAPSKLSAEEVASVTMHQFAGYNAHMSKSSGKSARNRKLICIESLYEYLEEVYQLQTPSSMIRRLRKNTRKTESIEVDNVRDERKLRGFNRLTEEEKRAFLKAMEHMESYMTKKQYAFYEKTRLRDIAIITLLLGTGIRLAECVGLDLLDVELEEKKMYVIQKGSMTRTVIFNDEVKEALQAYIELNRKKILPEKGHEKALFLSLQNKRISEDALQNMITKYGRLILPKKEIHTHTLRRTFGTSLYEASGDILLTSRALGHTSGPAVTANHYIDPEARLGEVAGYVKLKEDSSSKETSKKK